MATSGASIKLKRLRQRFGINAPKLAIRTHVAWYWQALAIIAIVAITLACAAWVYDAGRKMAGQQTENPAEEIRSLRNHVMELDSELTKLRTLAGTGESSLQMERAALKQLANQVKSLEGENAALREDLAFFEGLMPGAEANVNEAEAEAGLRIDHLRIEPTPLADEYRYRLLVINNAGRQTKSIRGNLELIVKVRLDGKDAMINVPSETGNEKQRFNFEIKHFHRLEGVFAVPHGASVLSVEARLLQDGVVRAKQSWTL